MKVFLVNLDKNPERLAAADAQLRKLGVEYERFPAVYGADLPKAEKRQAVNRFRWWCAVGRPVRDGEIGCALSHYALYRRMNEEKLPYACILEDDVVLDERFPKQLQRVAAWLNPDQPQVVLLSDHTYKRHAEEGIFPAQADMYAEGYILTAPAAQALLRANLPMQTPCDHWGRWVRSGAIQLYHAYPTVCSQNLRDFVSGTVPSDAFNVKKLSSSSRFLHNIARAFGKTMDDCLLWLALRVRKGK